MSGHELERLVIRMTCREDRGSEDYYSLAEPELLDQELSQARFRSLREVRIILIGYYCGTAALASGLRERMPRLSANCSLVFSVDVPATPWRPYVCATTAASR